jgi:hypothetical protein
MPYIRLSVILYECGTWCISVLFEHQVLGRILNIRESKLLADGRDFVIRRLVLCNLHQISLGRSNHLLLHAFSTLGNSIVYRFTRNVSSKMYETKWFGGQYTRTSPPYCGCTPSTAGFVGKPMIVSC